MIRSIWGIAGTVLILISTVGCSTAVSFPKWQEAVERYVRQDGRGDPNILRNTSVEAGRPGFALIGADDPRGSTDVKGLLLGHKRIGERPWFIYLVGLVKKQDVSEMHLAALNVQGGQYRWAVGKNDARALKSYRSFNEGQGKQRSVRSQAPITSRGFPQESDAFDLTVEGGVQAVHQGSGARWHLTVPGATTAARSGG